MKRIFVVDDDSGVLELIKMSITRNLTAGVDIQTSPLAAVEQIRNNSYDIVIFDYQLGEAANGIELYRTLSAELGDFNALLVTGFSDSYIEKDALDAGMKALIYKGDRFLSELVNAVKTLLQE